MDITNWCLIIASVLLVSANAGRYDQGPQRFFETSAPAPEVGSSYETKEIVLYLTPSQVQALEAGGVIVRPQESGPEEEETVETEQEGQEEEEESEQSNDKVEEEENLEEQKPKEVLELEEIFRILNKQIEEEAKRIHGDINGGQVSPTDEQEQGEEYEEEEQEEGNQGGEQDESQQDENTYQNQRKIPSRFGVLQRYRVEKYFAPSTSQKQNQQQRDENVRSQHKKPSRFQEQVDQKSEIESDNNEELPEQYKVIPVKEESQEENKQKSEVDAGQEEFVELFRPALDNNKIAQSIAQHKGKLVENEIQLYKGLQELKAAPKHHHRKYATEIEKLRANLEAQNALATAEALARASRFSGKEVLNKNNFELDTSNRESTSSILKKFALRNPQPFTATEASTPAPTPAIKKPKTEVKTTAPVKAGRRAPASTRSKVYVKVDSPYEEEVVPVKIDKRNPVSKPQEFTILRHLWEH